MIPIIELATNNSKTVSYGVLFIIVNSGVMIVPILIQGDADHPFTMYSGRTKTNRITHMLRTQQTRENLYNSVKRLKLILLKGWGSVL